MQEIPPNFKSKKSAKNNIILVIEGKVLPFSTYKFYRICSTNFGKIQPSVNCFICFFSFLCYPQ